jgi:hypothetical protein
VRRKVKATTTKLNRRGLVCEVGIGDEGGAHATRNDQASQPHDHRMCCSGTIGEVKALLIAIAPQAFATVSNKRTEVLAAIPPPAKKKSSDFQPVGGVRVCPDGRLTQNSITFAHLPKISSVQERIGDISGVLAGPAPRLTEDLLSDPRRRLGPKVANAGWSIRADQ